MLKPILAVSIAAVLLTGCSNTPKTAEEPTLSNIELNQNVQSTEQRIVDALTAQCGQQDEQLTALTEEVKTLTTELRDAIKSVNNKAAVIPVEDDTQLKIISQCPESTIGEKFLLGEVESVYVEEVKSHFATRIDTGAESSSLDARNIVLFERNGAQWVRFDVLSHIKDQPANTFESKVVRFVRIKQDADSPEDRRPVIHTHLKIGKYSAETDVNLTDRSHLEYPLLLGRKFMKDIAVVDVSQQFIHGKSDKQVTSANNK
ncbi:ATP-dependent zinc protease [Shewanella maritima]|uniref:ATP-dependent zinc protease family protein n=1 Tax=Shewanella maritima TaxID=2520507 RepID=UPI0037350A0A